MLPLIAVLNRWTRPDQWPLIGALGSASLLAGAFAFEVFGQYPPCPLCIEQRWLHAYALMAGLVIFGGFRLAKPDLAVFSRIGAAIMAVAFGLSAWRAGFHAGGEYKLWPLNCQASDVSGVTVDQLLTALNTPTNVVLCDEPAWTLLGLSMAGYNTLFSALMCALSLMAILRTPYRSL